ncbi:DUF1127 domain-containing protein [Jannaschia seohaensis]|uniref:Uncharacterized protein DUF1127 n=1 Tax=Jannaschia seohaensis TaxID=475081 RepID=A0A2Y9A4J3_9RHOB|nr:DUF1127 domain-containing protein [Jannaschia seohaensis]PWJ22528.1 uncharacterized protein DUF1127 [Jannaschia seohaensis]SSA38806.1 protein of unknown function [Jannaschia seohaensis]
MTSLRNAIRARRLRRSTYAALARLDDRSLEDIGFNRADIETRFG